MGESCEGQEGAGWRRKCLRWAAEAAAAGGAAAVGAGPPGQDKDVNLGSYWHNPGHAVVTTAFWSTKCQTTV